MSLRLVAPTKEHKYKVWEYRESFIKRGESICGGGNLRHAKTYEEWLSRVQAIASPDVVVDDLVTSTTFLVLNENNDMVAILDIRHESNELLFTRGGYIGYSVAPELRQQGIGTEMLELALEECRKIGMKRLLIVCDKNNVGSSKLIEKHDGVLENEVTYGDAVVKRYWIDL